MDNIVSVKLDSRYASTLGVWQYDYGQVLRITGPELPPAVEVQFSLDEKSGETLSRVGTTVDGVTEVKIPDELLTHSATSNYRIYVYIYLTDETSGNTKYEITIPVRVRSKPTSPTEDPETDPDLFRETVVAVNASAERAENAASSAMESAASADETLEEIKRVADGISEDIENANTAKSELSDTINSAGIVKKELESSIGKGGEAKTALDSAISSAEEKQLALDATVEQANTVDASLKEHIGSAEKIQANVEQIAKNKADISSLNEDLGEKETVLTDMQKKMSDSSSKDGFLLCDLNGNIVGHIASFEVWNDEPYNKKYGWGGHPYGNGKLPPYSKIVGILESDLLSVRGGKGRWNKDDTGNFQHGGHLFEGWNAEEDARLTFGIGTKNKDISWIQTFHAATQEGTDSGSYYCVTKVGSDIDNQGMNFMPSITQSRSLFSLKVGDDLSPNSKHIQKLIETGELVNWEYNKTDMIPYGTMYFDYSKDKVRVYTRTGGWKYLKFEEEV